MATKFDVRNIVGDHYKTLVDYSTGRPCIFDYLSHFFFPLLFSIAYLIYCPAINSEVGYRIDTTIVAAFAIFAALLFNLQIVVMGMIGSSAALNNSDDSENHALETKSSLRRRDFVNHIFFNISYAVIVSVTLVSLSIVVVFIDYSDNKLIKAIELFLVFHFLVVIFIILKRVHILFKRFPNP